MGATNIDISTPNLSEIRDTLKGQEDNKAPGWDNITAELLKLGRRARCGAGYPLNIKR